MRLSSLCWLGILMTIGVPVNAADERIEVGPLLLDVYISRTATQFHLVDQLSEWSYYCHRQYGRGVAPLSDVDRAMLERHKLVRAKHSWGEGLEQTFYSPLSLEEALQNGVSQGWLSSDEAATEREVLAHFAPRSDALLTAQQSALVDFREKLRGELAQRSKTIGDFARFTGRSPGIIPVYLLPNPDEQNIGGGYNGGRLTIEIPTVADAVPVALHEIFHAFLEIRTVDINAAVAGFQGLDEETMKEGLAYAFSPGLVHNGLPGEDPLAKTVGAQFVDGSPLSDALTRYNRYALSLRPLLKDALSDEQQTLTTFLPRAVDVWRALYEIEHARESMIGELQTVTITGLYGPQAPELPSFVREGTTRQQDSTEYFMACREWVAGTYRQMSAFYSRAGHEILFVAPKHSEVRGRLNGHTVSTGDGKFQAYGVEIVAEDRDKVVTGVAYTIKPINTDEKYRWVVSDQFTPVKLRE